MSEFLRNYTKALYGMDAVVQRVPADGWEAPSPCDGWTVGDVVAHAAGVLDAIATMARTGENTMPATADPAGDVVGMWNASRDGVLEALDHPNVIGRRGTYWFGESTLDDILAFAVWDPLGHAWDIATATGQRATPLDDVAEASMAVIGANAETLRTMGLMADPVEVSAHASPTERFLGLIGRDPAAVPG